MHLYNLGTTYMQIPPRLFSAIIPNWLILDQRGGSACEAHLEMIDLLAINGKRRKMLTQDVLTVSIQMIAAVAARAAGASDHGLTYSWSAFRIDRKAGQPGVAA